MTTAVHNGSAYPAPLEELLPKARDLAADLGDIPSRNRLKRELRVGGPKAAAVRDALVQERDGLAPGPVDSAGPAAEAGPAEPVDAPPPAEPVPVVGPDPDPSSGPVDGSSAREIERQLRTVADPGTPVAARRVRPVSSWPVLLLALPALVAIWSGWVGLGGLTGFGMVHPLPGIADRFAINSAITLPFGMETYAAYALRVWLSPGVPAAARRFARWSAIGSLVLGALGQVAYHLLVAAHVQAAPAWITTLVACLPVAVLGMGAALAHLLHAGSPARPT